MQTVQTGFKFVMVLLHSLLSYLHVSITAETGYSKFFVNTIATIMAKATCFI